MKARTAIFSSLVMVILLASTAWGIDTVPHQLNVQGVLRNSAGEAVTGSYDIKIGLYDAQTGGNTLYTATTTGYSVVGGVFDIYLGPMANIFKDTSAMYLGIQVKAHSDSTWDAEMPRVAVTSVGYAFQAEHAEQADELLGPATDVNCDSSPCIGKAEVTFPWALGVSAGGDAAGLTCSGCVGTTDINNKAVTKEKLGASNCYNGQILKLENGAWTCAPDQTSGGGGGSGDCGVGYNGVKVSTNYWGNCVYEGDPSYLDQHYVNEYEGDSITSPMIVDGQVKHADLFNDAVGTDNIQSKAVTIDKLSENGCSEGNILKVVWGQWACVAESGGGGSAGITGSGSTNYIPLWTGGTALGNSVMSQNSSNVTIHSRGLVVGNGIHASGVIRGDGGFNVDGHTVIDGDGGWHRSYGNKGWYNGTYHGGWYMTDSSWVRSYNNKGVYTTGEMQAGTVRANNKLCIGSSCRSSWSSGGDNLGNHTATTTLNMSGNDIDNAGTVTANAFKGDGTNVTSVNASKLQGHPASDFMSCQNTCVIHNQYSVDELANIRINGKAKANTFQTVDDDSVIAGNGAGMASNKMWADWINYDYNTKGLKIGDGKGGYGTIYFSKWQDPYDSTYSLSVGKNDTSKINDLTVHDLTVNDLTSYNIDTYNETISGELTMLGFLGNSSRNLYIGSGLFGPYIKPASDDIMTIGTSSQKLLAVYAYYIIGTSDRNLKYDIRDVDDTDLTWALNSIRKAEIGFYWYKGEHKVATPEDKKNDFKHYRPYPHLGAMAQSLPDVVKQPGENLINLTDMIGLSYTAIRALDRNNQRLKAKVTQLQGKVDYLTRILIARGIVTMDQLNEMNDLNTPAVNR